MKTHLFGESDNSEYCIKMRMNTVVIFIYTIEFHGFRFKKKARSAAIPGMKRK